MLCGSMAACVSACIALARWVALALVAICTRKNFTCRVCVKYQTALSSGFLLQLKTFHLWIAECRFHVFPGLEQCLIKCRNGPSRFYQFFFSSCKETLGRVKEMATGQTWAGWRRGRGKWNASHWWTARTHAWSSLYLSNVEEWV